MKRNLIFGTVFAAAMAVGAAAQTPGSQTPSSQTPSTQPPSSQMPSSSQRQSEKSGQTITVTGCLQSAEGGSVGTTGTGAPGAAPSARASADTYILADATMGSAPSTPGAAGEKAPGAAGTTGAPGASAAGTTYRLVGGDKSDLKKYANSQVEIRGRLDSSGGAAAGGAMGGTSARPGASGQQLHVESIRQIASSCTK